MQEHDGGPFGGGGSKGRRRGVIHKLTLIAVHLTLCEEGMVRWSSCAWEGRRCKQTKVVSNFLTYEDVVGDGNDKGLL